MGSDYDWGTETHIEYRAVHIEDGDVVQKSLFDCDSDAEAIAVALEDYCDGGCYVETRTVVTTPWRRL